MPRRAGHQDMTMDHTTNSPQSSGGTPQSRVSRRYARLETQAYPIDESYMQFPMTSMPAATSSPFVMNQNEHLGGHQESPMVDHGRDDNYGFSEFAPPSVAYPPFGYHYRAMDSIAMDNIFGLPAQRTDGGYHPSGTPTATTSDAFSPGLQPENDIQNPAANIQTETTPDSSTVPEYATTGSSSSPIIPSNSGLEEPGMVMWSYSGDINPVSRIRKRRKMTGDELVRNRALKAAGGACDDCRRSKKKCHHKDDQLILSAPAPSPGPSRRTPVNIKKPLALRTRLARPRPDDSNRHAVAVGPQHQQQRSQSVASSYDHSVHNEPSLFSPSNGGTSSNGTMTSTQSDAVFAVDEYHPEMGVEEQFDMETAGFGQQFNGQLAPRFNPINIMNAANNIGFNYNWPTDEHSGKNDH